MDITITGTNSPTALQLEKAAGFFAKNLLHARTIPSITLDIEVVDTLDEEGECVNEDGTKRSRWFTIILRRQPVENMIETLAHEMVHLKQYVKNELRKDYRKGTKHIETYWHGNIWQPSKGEDRYWDAPWEIEAYGREVGLNHKWVAYNG